MASSDLDAAIDGEEDTSEPTAQVREDSEVELPLERIRPDPDQPRSAFSDESLAGMVTTIQSGGLLQAIVVRPDPEEEGFYRIVAGHRRFRAHELAGLTTIRAIIRNYTDEQALLAALIENIQREDLSPFDEAATYERFVSNFGWEQKRLAQETGKPPSVISETLKIGKLPPKIKDEYADYPVAKSVLILLTRPKSVKAQLALWEQVKELEDRTVDAVREILTESQGKPSTTPSTVSKQIAQVLSAAGRLNRFPIEYFQENQPEYRKLVELTAALMKLVETLRQQFGEPKVEPPKSARGRKPKATAPAAESEQTKPMEPA
jgi:ParB family chromosome partitioning protein